MVKIIPALVTTLNEDGTFDKGSMEKQINFILEYKVDGIFILGSVGEGSCFGLREREEIISVTVSEANTNPTSKVPVYVGTSRNSLGETLDFVRQAERIGASYVVVHPPLWRKGWISEDSLYEYFRAIAEQSHIPVVLYNLPDATEISINLMHRLSKISNIVAVKDSSGNPTLTAKFASSMPTYQGDDRLIMQSLRSGAVGIISGLWGIFPEKLKALIADYTTRNSNIEERQREVVSLIEELMGFSNPLAAEKLILEKRGICKRYVARPYILLSKEEERKALRLGE